MTLIEVMIVLAIIALVMGLLVGPAILDNYRRAQVDASHAMTRQIVSAWTRWRLTSTSECPASIDELKPELGRNRNEVIRDPWGEPYLMKCGDEVPAGCDVGACVLSKGPDNKEDTPDDIKSWESSGHR